MALHRTLVCFVSLALPVFTACGGDDEGDTGNGGDGDSSNNVGTIELGDGDGDIGTTGDGDTYMRPSNFVAADFGGYALGEELKEGVVVPTVPTTSDGGCGTEIVGVVRDFRRGDLPGGHPDFETFTGAGEQGIVEAQLGEDLKPVHAPGDHEFTTSEELFNQWYRNEEGVNIPFLAYFSFQPNGNVLTFHSSNFYPLDNAGFGNEDHEHNYAFTTEIHTEFRYNGGETFSFTGDDDLWVFINGQLAIDLGGLHAELTESVDLDQSAAALGISPGNTYPLDLFHAERHTTESNFRVDTNLEFTNCNIVIDTVVR